MKLEILQNEMITAMKEQNKIRKDTISSMISAIKKTAIDKKCKDNITEELINKVLLKEQKTMQEMIDTCPKDRTETLAEYECKMAIIKEFAPSLLTDEVEIENMIKSLDIPLEKSNRGNIMKALKGKVDMKIANKVVSSLLV